MNLVIFFWEPPFCLCSNNSPFLVLNRYSCLFITVKLVYFFSIFENLIIFLFQSTIIFVQYNTDKNVRKSTLVFVSICFSFTSLNYIIPGCFSYSLLYLPLVSPVSKYFPHPHFSFCPPSFSWLIYLMLPTLPHSVSSESFYSLQVEIHCMIYLCIILWHFHFKR